MPSLIRIMPAPVLLSDHRDQSGDLKGTNKKIMLDFMVEFLFKNFL
jgi:hypothetical protein